MARAQITVRGGGIIGLSIAWEAVRRGAQVRLIETHVIGAGSSGGVVGALTPHVPENWNAKKAFQLDSLLMAQDFWDGVHAASNLPTGYARLGRLQPVADASALALAQMRAAGATQLWGGQARWDLRACIGHPFEPASPTGMLVYDTLSARLHPRLAARALCAAIVAMGGEVILGPGQDVGAVIWATGVAGLQDLSRDMGHNISGGVKGQAALLRLDMPDMPQIFADTVHIVPHIDGTVAVGSTSENLWHQDTTTDTQLDALLARACAALPVLANAPVIERWAGIRPRAPSRAPILGAWPGRDGHFIANGGFKIGFGMAPKIAQTLVDLVIEGRDTIPQDFTITRAFAK